MSIQKVEEAMAMLSVGRAVLEEFYGVIYEEISENQKEIGEQRYFDLQGLGFNEVKNVKHSGNG